MAEDKLDIKSEIGVSIVKPQVASVTNEVAKATAQVVSGPHIALPVPRIHKLTPVAAQTRVLRFANGDVIEVPGCQLDIAHDSDLLE